MFGTSLIGIARVAAKSLRLHLMRSALTMLGIIIGVWAVITLVAIGEGASHDAQEEIKSLGARNIIIRSVKPPSMRTQLQGDWESFFRRWLAYYGLKNSDAVRIRDTIPRVQRVLPILTQRKNVVFGERKVDCQLIGTFPYYPEFTQARIVAGRFLSPVEEGKMTQSCVISHSLAKNLLSPNNPLGQTIEIRGYEANRVFKVIGIIEERGTRDQLPQLDESMGQALTANVYIPLASFKSLYSIRDIDRSVGDLKLQAVDLTEIRVEFESEEDVVPSIPLIHEALLTGRTERDYEIIVPIQLLNALREQKARDTRMLLYIACISLLVGGIGIMNIMLATVTERTNEIGVRRALGATQVDITIQFLVETLILCLIGGTIGVLGGWGFAEIRHHYLHITTIVTNWSVFIAFGLSVAVAIIFGLYPARRAAHLDPIEALRHS
tara:strand:+ start:1469 stop:2782 length:1314 start_codon:yes stop_codon:yes gene_type:complete